MPPSDAAANTMATTQRKREGVLRCSKVNKSDARPIIRKSVRKRVKQIMLLLINRRNEHEMKNK